MSENVDNEYEVEAGEEGGEEEDALEQIPDEKYVEEEEWDEDEDHAALPEELKEGEVVIEGEEPVEEVA